MTLLKCCFYLLVTFFFNNSITHAQVADSSLIKFSGYAEIYYGYDFSRPSNNLRPGFTYSHNGHNEVAINIGMLKVSVTEDRVRANFALMAGTYTMVNLAHEPIGLRNVFEANIGLKLL
ncbi:MAG: outer membrane beta-barrel protein [Flavobacteriales bacterium]